MEDSERGRQERAQELRQRPALAALAGHNKDSGKIHVEQGEEKKGRSLRKDSKDFTSD